MGVKDRLLGTFGDNLAESMTSRAYRAGQGRPAARPAVTPGDAPMAPDPMAGVARHRKAVTIEVGRIEPDPNQPRREFDRESIGLLARSLTERGQLMPIRVRWDQSSGTYRIVAGERRWRAAVEAGLPVLECVISDRPRTEDELLEEQLIENCVREDLRPIEQARAFKQLMDRLQLSFRELADRLHLSHAAVHRAVALLDTPDPVQAMITAGAIPPSAAYEISKLTRSEDQLEVAQAAAERKMTRDQVVEAVKARKAGRPTSTPPSRRDFKLPNGDKVSITVASGEVSLESVISALKSALKAAQAEVKAGRPGAAA
ncbi:MAG: ParB/RepB/Spo0J family partition protein [Isosphaeraceae bacterium]